MNKLSLLGIGNEGRWNYFVFKKENSFFPLFASFLSCLRLEKTGIMYGNEDEKKDIKGIVDKLENTKNKDYDLDIFYGDKRIIVVVRTDETNRGFLVSEIKKIANFKR